MGKSSSAKADVVEYRMSLHVGLGHQLDAITEVRVDEKVAWRGNITDNQAVQINQPNLFGGQRKEGGLVGTMQVLMGKPDQVLPVAAASRYGKAPQDCPAFRGITTLMFHGSNTISTGRPGEWDAGQSWSSYYNSGFLWKMNSTFIAQKIEVTGRRAPKGLNPATAMIGADANPVHIIYESLVNDEWGMGGAPSLINKEGFELSGKKIFDESFGMSLWWMRQETIENFITDILDHIQATLFINPNTGLLDIKLLRDDYDISTLRHITPDNAALSNFKRRSSGEIVNEITVSFTNPLNEKSESITAQDIASIESQGGKKVSGSRDYYGIRSRKLATEVLQRDLAASTAPLVSLDATIDRSAWDILPGEAVLVSWPKRNTYSMVMRSGKVNYGKPLDSSVRVSLLQDIFSLPKPAIALLPGTEWVDPATDPQPLTMRLFTVPAFFSRNAEIQSEPIDLGEGEALVGALADSETYDSFDYELVSESVAATGDTVITSKGAKSMTPLGHLSSSLVPASVSTLPYSLFPVVEETPVVGGFLFIGYGDTNQEIALVLGRTPLGWTISRGVLDTVPRTWAAGTPVWVVNPGARIVDSQTIHAAGVTTAYRGLDRTSRGLLGYDDAPTETIVVTERPHLPIRPANVRLNGVGFGPVAAGSTEVFDLTWSTRNRLMEDSQILHWVDGPIQPEYRQETVVLVTDASTGILLKTYGGLWTETGLSFNVRNLSRYASLRFEVLSKRDELWSLTGHSITLTGLPADPSAPPLPDAQPISSPPSFRSAPALGAFVAQVEEELSGDGGILPLIGITGMQDDPNAEWLICRYRMSQVDPNSVGPWYTTSPLPLGREVVHFSIRGVQGKATYDVMCAYFDLSQVGNWRDLGQITTGPLVAGIISDNASELILAEMDARLEGAVANSVADAVAGLDGLISGRDEAEKVAELVLETMLNEHDSLEREAAQRIKDLAGEAIARGEAFALAIATSQQQVDDYGSLASSTYATIVGMNGGLAATLNESKSFTNGVVSTAMTTVYTKAQTDAGNATTLSQAKSHTDAYKSEASITYATQAAMGAGLAATLNESKSFTSGQISTAMNTVYTKAQTDAGLATTLNESKSHTDAYKSEASLLFSTKAERASGDASAILEAKSHTDAYKSEASLTYATKAAMASGLASTLTESKSFTDGQISTAMNAVYTKAQTDAGLSTTLNSAKSYTDDYKSEAEQLFSSKSELGGVSATASMALTTAVDAKTQLGEAAFEVVVGSGGNPAAIYAKTKGSSSVAGMIASVLRFGNTVGSTVVDAMMLVAGEVFFMRPIYVDVGDKRLIVGPGGTWVLWFGPNTISAASATRTNGHWAFGTDGKVYYGAAELTSSAGFHAQASHDVRIGTRTSPGQVTTDSVTVTTTGATGTVSYAWSQIGGDEAWTITSSSAATTAFRVNVATGGEIKRATFACRATDSGSGRSMTIIVGGAAIYNI